MNKRSTYQVILIIIFLFIFRSNILALFSFSINETEKYKLENEVLKESTNEYINKYNELLNTIDYKNISLSDTYLISKVLFRNQTEFYNQVIINYGENESLKKGMAVVSKDGLIGLISSVEEKHSFVKLLTASNMNIPVKINNAYGVITDYKDECIIVSQINNFETLNEGDKVMTSNYGSLPENIFVGYVKSVKHNDLGLEQIVCVKSNANFKNINYLYINKELIEI